MNGWIFIDKPKNITSFNVIQRIRNILNIKKIGHAGTLDPLATGIFAIAIEKQQSIYYLINKEYKFNVVFGETNDTDDITENNKKIKYNSNFKRDKSMFNIIHR